MMNQKSMKHFMRAMFFCMFFAACISGTNLTAHADTKTTTTVDTSVVDTSMGKVKDFAASVVSGIGTIIALWGIFEFSMAMQGNDGMMQSHAFKRIAGGLLGILAPQILTMLT